MSSKYIDSIIELAVIEDIGDGDHSSLCCIPKETIGKSRLLVKEDGVLAGVEIALKIFNRIDPTLKVELYIKDGTEVRVGDVVFIVEGKVHSILRAERLVLNTMQRMSGIATVTCKYVKELEGYKTKVLDTRKTTPGLRILEKMAVKIGGGLNHRMGLFDMIMLKDNHVDFAGGVKNAITKANNYLKETGKKLQIIIEVRNMDELNEVLAIGGVDRVMLDNFDIEATSKAVQVVNGRVATEASGGITIERLKAYASCGVDYISIGALTHSVKSLDLSLKAVE